MATGELLGRADFTVAYPEIRNQLLQQVEIGQEQRLDLRSQVITALQTTSDIPTQARYIDLLTQIAESAGWWVPTPDYIAADVEAFNKYKSALGIMRLRPEQMEELLPQSGEAIQPNPKPKSPTLRNDPEDVFMHFAVESTIEASGIWHTEQPYDGLVNFVEFIRQHPDVLPFIKELCTDAFNKGNLSCPPIFDGFHWYTPQGQAREGIPAAEDFYQAWQTHADDIRKDMMDYSVVRYSPSTSRYHRLLEKLTGVLKERNIQVATIADYGSGVGFDPDTDLVNLLKEKQMIEHLTRIFAYDLIPDEYALKKEIEGIALDYKKRDISDGLFTSATEPKTDFSMSLSVLNHLQSKKRVDILEGMLRKTNAALLIAYGGAYGRNYWDEENPTKLLPRGRDRKQNGWLFIKNPQGGLDFVPLSTTT